MLPFGTVHLFEIRYSNRDLLSNEFVTPPNNNADHLIHLIPYWFVKKNGVNDKTGEDSRYIYRTEEGVDPWIMVALPKSHDPDRVKVSIGIEARDKIPISQMNPDDPTRLFSVINVGETKIVEPWHLRLVIKKQQDIEW